MKSKKSFTSNETDCKCKYSIWLAFSCSIGFLLSLYAVYVEHKAEEDNDYQAMCDISEKISCSKVFLSRYGKGFGIVGLILGDESPWNQPNGFLGLVFYSIVGGLSFINNKTVAKVQLILSALSLVLSLYLAYLLYFVLEDFCVVCVSTYVVNFVNLIISRKRYNLLKKQTSEIPSKSAKKQGKQNKSLKTSTSESDDNNANKNKRTAKKVD